jgi:hypothetical protein
VPLTSQVGEFRQRDAPDALAGLLHPIERRRGASATILVRPDRNDAGHPATAAGHQHALAALDTIEHLREVCLGFEGTDAMEIMIGHTAKYIIDWLIQLVELHLSQPLCSLFF